MRPSIYLAGPVYGKTALDAIEWRNYVTQKLETVVDCYSPLRAKQFDHEGVFTGTCSKEPLWTDRGITTRDRLDVMRCDGLIVNFLGATRVSIGTCVELGWADAWRKPTIVVMEEENIHNHPMVRDIAGYIVRDLDAAVTLAKALFTPHDPNRNVTISRPKHAQASL
jgi:nucleoside 2-deoxyribosyltransferase